jgi:hypothetical protein
MSKGPSQDNESVASSISSLTADSIADSSSGIFKADELSYLSDDLIDFFEETKDSLNLQNKAVKTAIKEKLNEIKKELKDLENKPENLLFTSILLNNSQTEKQIELYQKQLNFITSFQSERTLKKDSSENQKLEVKNYLDETNTKIAILGIINHQLSAFFNEEQKEIFGNSAEIILRYRQLKESDPKNLKNLTENFINNYSPNLDKIFSDEVINSVIEIFQKIITENQKAIAANISGAEFNSFSQAMNNLLDQQAKFSQIIASDNILERIEKNLESEGKDSSIPSSVFLRVNNATILSDKSLSEKSKSSQSLN